jgi:hypothetical protein
MTLVVYPSLAWNWSPDVARTDPQAAGAWYSESPMVERPKQSTYTADLTVSRQDLSRMEDSFILVPLLCRSARLALSAGCAPLLAVT